MCVSQACQSAQCITLHFAHAGEEPESKSGLIALIMLRSVPYKGTISYQARKHISDALQAKPVLWHLHAVAQ